MKTKSNIKQTLGLAALLLLMISSTAFASEWLRHTSVNDIFVEDNGKVNVFVSGSYYTIASDNPRRKEWLALLMTASVSGKTVDILYTPSGSGASDNSITYLGMHVQ